MSLPPLPDIFGNYALGDFNEVVSPPDVGQLGLVLLRRLWRALLHWQRNRYRGEAERRLARLALDHELPVRVNEILKLSAMAAFSRQQVASLSGPKWPGFLNATCDTPPFDAAACE